MGEREALRIGRLDLKFRCPSLHVIRRFIHDSELY